MPGWFQKLFRDDQTHFLALTKHFFRQFFENEFISRGSEARLGVVHVLALLALPGILYTFYIIPTYDDIRWFFPWQYHAVTVIDQCRYVTFSMIVIGIIAILEWDTLFLDRRDYAILGPLPLKGPAVFAAKVTSLLLFLSLFIVDVGGISTLMYPLVESTGIRGPQVSFLRLSGMVLAHAMAVFGGSVFMFLFFVAVQGVLINFLRPRAFKIVSRCFQLQAIVALLLLLFLLPIISAGLPAWERSRAPGLLWVPPLWFVGVYQTLLGSGDAVFHSLAKIALLALGLVTLACVAGYVISYKRQMQRALEASEALTGEISWLTRATRWALNRFLLRKPHERATYFFVVNTLLRNTKHRLYLATYIGVGCALAASGIFEVLARSARRDFSALLFQPNEVLLAIPLILSFFLLSGMRVVFTIPAELHANWVFQLAEDESWPDCWSGARKVMVLRAVLLLLLLFPFYAVLWGWLVASGQLIFDLALSFILVELLLLNFRKVPFACSYQPGKAYITVLGAFYWLAFTTYAYTMATLERWLLQDAVRWIVFMFFTLLVLGGLVLWRKKRLVEGLGLIYEDEPNPDVQTLGLGT
jgi:hypothetical protein